MPFGAVALRPGINAEFTPTLNEAGISSGNLIRFREGQVEKLGGWQQFYPFSIGSTVRALHAWEDLNSDTHLAVGALQSLSVITDGGRTTITPQTTTTNVTVNFSTTNGSNVVSIVDPSITPNTQNTVFIQTQVSVGGLILFGVYPIATVTGANSYTILADSNATATVANGGAVAVYDTTNGSSTVTVTLNNHGLSTGDTYYALVSTTGGGVTIFGQYPVTVLTANTFSIITDAAATLTTTFNGNGGNVRFLYYITLGPQSASSGYGLGGYGLGGYGLGIAPPSGSGTPITTTDWTLDNWGQILVACPDGGAIYTWTPGAGYQTASIIEEAPNVNTGIFIAMPQRMIVAYGSCDVDGVQDPLLIRWCAASDFNDWTASSTDQAGRFRIPTGSRIVGALQAPQQGLIWTDIDMWSMQYVQPPLVFGFNKIMTGCGLVGKHAMGILGGTVYWMSQKQFFVKGSAGPQPLPCTVWDSVFQNIDTSNLDKVVCAINSEFNEVAWFYPSSSSGGVIDRYVKFNPVEKAWDTGSIGRTAWIDQSVLGSPIGSGTDNLIYQHEMTYNANGVAMTSFFETGYFVLAEGEEFVFLDMLLPDMKWGTFVGAQTASVQVTVTMVDWPNGPERAYGPFTMSASQEFINTRCRGRQAKLKFQSSDAGSFWRLGRIRYRFAKDGRR